MDTKLYYPNTQKKKRTVNLFQTSLSYFYYHCQRFALWFISFRQVSTATINDTDGFGKKLQKIFFYQIVSRNIKETGRKFNAFRLSRFSNVNFLCRTNEYLLQYHQFLFIFAFFGFIELHKTSLTAIIGNYSPCAWRKGNVFTLSVQVCQTSDPRSLPWSLVPCPFWERGCPVFGLRCFPGKEVKGATSGQDWIGLSPPCSSSSAWTGLGYQPPGQDRLSTPSFTAPDQDSCAAWSLCLGCSCRTFTLIECRIVVLIFNMELNFLYCTDQSRTSTEIRQKVNKSTK